LTGEIWWVIWVLGDMGNMCDLGDMGNMCDLGDMGNMCDLDYLVALVALVALAGRNLEEVRKEGLCPTTSCSVATKVYFILLTVNSKKKRGGGGKW
jgi:hypothetical protein